MNFCFYLKSLLISYRNTYFPLKKKLTPFVLSIKIMEGYLLKPIIIRTSIILYSLYLIIFKKGSRVFFMRPFNSLKRKVFKDLGEEKFSSMCLEEGFSVVNKSYLFKENIIFSKSSLIYLISRDELNTFQVKPKHHLPIINTSQILLFSKRETYNTYLERVLEIEILSKVSCGEFVSIYLEPIIGFSRKEFLGECSIQLYFNLEIIKGLDIKSFNLFLKDKTGSFYYTRFLKFSDIYYSLKYTNKSFELGEKYSFLGEVFSKYKGFYLGMEVRNINQKEPSENEDQLEEEDLEDLNHLQEKVIDEG
uniref:hypothetical protein n=1 Tax=Thelohanellus kitauei TaxID=669202 RepID=UPI003001928C